MSYQTRELRRAVYALCEDIQSKSSYESDFDRGMRTAARRIAKEICAIDTPLAAPSQPEGAPTGWPPGMLQDDDRKLSRALAATPHARAHADEAAAAIRAAQPEGPQPVAWKDMTSWMRAFLGKGEGYVRTLYNEPHDAINRTDVGAWIQAASDLLRCLQSAGAAAPDEGEARDAALYRWLRSYPDAVRMLVMHFGFGYSRVQGAAMNGPGYLDEVLNEVIECGQDAWGRKIHVALSAPKGEEPQS